MSERPHSGDWKALGSRLSPQFQWTVSSVALPTTFDFRNLPTQTAATATASDQTGASLSSKTASDEADLRVMEMQLIEDLEQRFGAAELLLDALLDHERQRAEESRMLLERIKIGDGKRKEQEEEAHLLRVQLEETMLRERDKRQEQDEQAEKLRVHKLEWEQFRERMAERERKWELERGKHRELQAVFEGVVQEVQTERDALIKQLREVEGELHDMKRRETEMEQVEAARVERERLEKQEKAEEVVALQSRLEEAERREGEAARVQQKLRHHLQHLETELATERRRHSTMEQQQLKEQQTRSFEVLEAQRYLNDALVKHRQLEGELATERATSERSRKAMRESASKERALQAQCDGLLEAQQRLETEIAAAHGRERALRSELEEERERQAVRAATSFEREREREREREERFQAQLKQHETQESFISQLKGAEETVVSRRGAAEGMGSSSVSEGVGEGEGESRSRSSKPAKEVLKEPLSKHVSETIVAARSHALDTRDASWPGAGGLHEMAVPDHHRGLHEMVVPDHQGAGRGPVQWLDFSLKGGEEAIVEEVMGGSVDGDSDDSDDGGPDDDDKVHEISFSQRRSAGAEMDGTAMPGADIKLSRTNGSLKADIIGHETSFSQRRGSANGAVVAPPLSRPGGPVYKVNMGHTMLGHLPVIVTGGVATRRGGRSAGDGSGLPDSGGKEEGEGSRSEASDADGCPPQGEGSGFKIPLLWQPGNTPRAGRTPPQTPAEDKASAASPGPNAPLSGSGSPTKNLRGRRPDGSPLSAKALKNGLPYMREWKLRERARSSVRECVEAEEERIRAIVSAREQEERSLSKIRLLAAEEAKLREGRVEHEIEARGSVDEESGKTGDQALVAQIGVHTRRHATPEAATHSIPVSWDGGGEVGTVDEVETLSSFLANRKKEAPLCDGHQQVGTRFGYERGLQGKCPLALAICVAAGVCVCGAREAQMRGEDLRRTSPEPLVPGTDAANQQAIAISPAPPPPDLTDGPGAPSWTRRTGTEWVSSSVFTPPPPPGRAPGSGAAHACGAHALERPGTHLPTSNTNRYPPLSEAYSRHLSR